MGEMCLDCWNKLCSRNDPPEKYVFSRKPRQCAECGQKKYVIIREKRTRKLSLAELLFHL